MSQLEAFHEVAQNLGVGVVLAAIVQFQVKLLRRNGVLRPPEAVSAAPWVLVQIISTRSRGSGGRCVQLHRHGVTLQTYPPPVRELFDAVLVDVGAEQMILRGIERVVDADGNAAAVVQEWCLMRVTLGPGGWPEARERGVTDDVALL